MNNETDNKPSKEWQLIETTLEKITAEQRRSRQWGIVFKSLGFVYLFVLLLALYVKAPIGPGSSDEPHVGIIRIQGVIAESEPANANAIASALRKAFENDHARAIVLAINSPGGSPVQSSYIYNEITRLRGLHKDKKVYAVISDIGASGAYYIASAADAIYANPSSLVGSIGVTSSGFGFVGLIDKLGIERRAYTAGEHKLFLDPFSPKNPEETEIWSKTLQLTHQQFIDDVEKGRGDKLVENDKLYSGLVWNGTQARELGLVDEFGSAGQLARDVIGIEEFIDYTQKPNPLSRIVEKLGVSMGKGISQHLMNQQGFNASLQ